MEDHKNSKFKFLDEDFFKKTNGNYKEIVEKEMGALLKGVKELQCPKQVLLSAAKREELRNSEQLIDSLFAFHHTMTALFCRSNTRVADRIRDLFKQRALEEWILYYMECCFLTHDTAKGVFFSVKRQGIFNSQSKIKLIYPQNGDFFKNQKLLIYCPTCKRMNQLFENLHMSQISSRESRESFTHAFLPYLEENLTKSCYAYFTAFLDLDEFWSGDWYVCDTELLVDHFLAEFEKGRKKNLMKCDPTELADLFFVSILIKLIKEGITEYEQILQLDFEGLGRHYEDFKEENNFVSF